jgi:hypothetical protein
MKLTLNRVDSLECPEGKRDVLVFDGEQRGLGVRVTAGGSKTYLAQKIRLPRATCSGVEPGGCFRGASRGLVYRDER